MTTISYDLPIADYISGLDQTGHVTHQSFKKTSVTLHHNGGNLTHAGVLATWTTRPASAHFDVDASGSIAQYVRVNEYAWAVGSTSGNETSISIEMANSTFAPNWEVSETTWKAAARLAAWLFVHVIGEAPTSSNLFPHKHWSSTDCPGPFVSSHFNEILSEIQTQYNEFKSGSTGTPKPAPAPAKKTIIQIAAEVINGKWGNGSDRVHRLLVAGYDPNAVQAEVNRELGVSTDNKKSVLEIATEVIDGKWGNGADRVSRLKAAGYDPAAVQAEVNRRLL